MRSNNSSLLTFILVFLIMSIVKAQPAKSFVPAWAKKAIWYQIFPERFRNGDPDNDPKQRDIIGADPQGEPQNFRIHPWGSDWYELQPYEQANGDKELWKHLLRRRYGGDLQGIIDKLDYLKELGVTALYLNPVFYSPSHHKYDGNMYHHIDPNFGPDPAGDRKLISRELPHDPSTWKWTKADELALKLIAEAHKRGMKIIFDGVFNHMGINSPFFRDVKKLQKKSFYKDWFNIDSWDDYEKGTKFKYTGWFGVPSLPELREDEKGIVKGPKEYIFACTNRWMNPKGKGKEHGIDGWRLDVAFCIKHPFWKDWRKFVKKINRNAYLTAELILPPEETKTYLQGDEFDAEMNYNFAFACMEFFVNKGKTKITASEFDKKLTNLRSLYAPGVAEVSMNLFGSHDANRLASHIVNRGISNYRNWGEYFGKSKAADNPAYLVRKPNEEDKRIQKLMVLFQFTYTGAPMIYYGDEVGMWGANDPDCRKPMVWDDIQYQPEVYNPDGSKRIPDTVEQDKDLLSYYTRLIHLRKKTPELLQGEYKTLYTDDESGCFAFERSYKGRRSVCIFNTGKKAVTVNLSIPSGKKFVEAFTGEEIKSSKAGLIMSCPGGSGRVFTEKRQNR